MSDQSFDAFLARALAPPERAPDRAFVGQVQALVRLDRHLRAERRAALRRLGLEALAVGSLAAALMWLVRSPQIASAIAESPAYAVAAFLTGFALLAVLFSTGEAARARG